MSYHRTTPDKIKGNINEVKISARRIALEELENDEFKNELEEITEASREDKKD